MAEFVPGRKQERTIEEIRAQIDEEFNKEGLHRIVQNLASDQHRRIIRKNHPAVLTWEPDPVPTGEYYNLKPASQSSGRAGDQSYSGTSKMHMPPATSRP